jgi:hypothetical protein
MGLALVICFHARDVYSPIDSKYKIFFESLRLAQFWRKLTLQLEMN